MSEKIDDTAYEKRKNNGADQKRKNDDPLPGLNIRELIEERNWTALAGLGLIALGVVYILTDVFNLSFALWAWMLLAAGGWLMADAWQKYDAAGRVWVGHTRNRMVGGGLIALVGLLGALNISWWSIGLLGAGVWLGRDTWKRYTAAGRTWTQGTRNRMFMAGMLALLGLLSLIPVWSTWPLLIIVIGVVMLYRHGHGRPCC